MVIKTRCWSVRGPTALPVKQQFTGSKVRSIRNAMMIHTGFLLFMQSSQKRHMWLCSPDPKCQHTTAIPLPTRDGRIYCPAVPEPDKAERRGRGKKKMGGKKTPKTMDMACANPGRNLEIPEESPWKSFFTHGNTVRRKALCFPGKRGSQSLYTQMQLHPPKHTSADPPPNRNHMKILPFS